MTSRGFIAPIDGNVRMRWARPGYDARDMTLDGNKVAFDSSYAGTLNYLGQYIYTPPYVGTQTQWDTGPSFPTTSTRWIEWPDRGYIPLVLLHFGGRNCPADPNDGTFSPSFHNAVRAASHFNRGWSPYVQAYASGAAARTQFFEMKAKSDGLYLRAVNFSLKVRFVRATIFAVET